VSVSSVYLWRNGVLMVFDDAGDQVPELQGPASVEKVREIQRRSSRETKWYGFGEEGPLIWRAW
jgi:hypothetical protein